MILMNTMSKRNVYITVTVVVIFLMGIMAIASFGRNKSKDNNKSFQNTVIDIEKNIYKLNTLAISYDEFKQNTDKYLSSYVPNFYKQSYNIYAQDRFVYSYTGKHYSEKDWTGLTLNQLKKIGERLSKSVFAFSGAFNYSSFEISNVFEDNSNSNPSLHFKYIFVKYLINIDSVTVPLYKKYAFKKENGNFVLFSIEYIQAVKNQELEYANEEVKFVQKINLNSTK